MVGYGLDPVKAIATATKNAAQVLDLPEKTGEHCTGAVADGLVVKGDASQDITALKQICEVFQSGAKVHRAI
jgi:imidazolonepropionase-like amidohydrolase